MVYIRTLREASENPNKDYKIHLHYNNNIIYIAAKIIVESCIYMLL